MEKIDTPYIDDTCSQRIGREKKSFDPYKVSLLLPIKSIKEQKSHFFYDHLLKDYSFSLHLGADAEDIRINEDFHFDICGKKYDLPLELVDLSGKIEDASEEILGLKDNWDDEGSQAFEKQTLLGVADFLVVYSKYIFNKYHQVIDIPYITPSSNGSIDIDWDTTRYCFVVNIAKNGDDAEYYSSDQNQQESKGHFLVHNFNVDLLPFACVKE